MGGVVRTYDAVLTAKRPAPLVIVLHGKEQQGKDIIERSDWPALAIREHFSAVFPDAMHREWNDIRAPEGLEIANGNSDDIGFLMALIDRLVAQGIADPQRVYVAGVSNGGAMALTMACVRAPRIAAAASAIMNLTEFFGAHCRPSQPVPVLLMNGTRDPVVPYSGGLGARWFPAGGYWSTRKSLEFWRKIDGCGLQDKDRERLPDKDSSDNSRVTRITSMCAPDLDVVLYEIEGGGHRVPGWRSDARLTWLVDKGLGAQNHDIDGPEATWNFFKRFDRRAPPSTSASLR